MRRRNFIQQSVFAGSTMFLPAAMLTSNSIKKSLSDKPFKLNYAFHDGMFKYSAGKDFTDQIRYGYDQGFRAIEDNGMMDRLPADQEKIGNLLTKLNMSMGVFVHAFDHWPVSTSLCSGSTEWRDKFLKYTRQAIDVSKRCTGKLITVVPGNYDRTIPFDYQTTHVIEALKPAAEILEPHQIVMVLEPLSDTPDLFLRHSSQAYAICKSVNSSSCKILFDIYHMQRNEGDLIKGIDRAYDEISYYQIGDNPGRNEPGTGEVNYKNIFRHLFNKGYKGMLGMEHGNSIPGKEGEAALITAYREADSF
ncbi:MAG TPA: TIM barrel protein [Puia sp.]|nr:TIM barrel protein [Puia sp.]